MAGNGVVRWVDIGVDGIRLSIGNPMWDKGQLSRARTALRQNDRAGNLAAAIDAAGRAGLHPDEPELKKPLKDLDQSHEHPELTRYKSLELHRQHPPRAWLTKPGAFDGILDEWAAAEPAAAWLADNVGAPDEFSR